MDNRGAYRKRFKAQAAAERAAQAVTKEVELYDFSDPQLDPDPQHWSRWAERPDFDELEP